jgi:ATP adenylyltransferase
VSLEHLWAGWRTEYVAAAAEGNPERTGDQCIFCRIAAAAEPDEETLVVWRGERVLAVLNLFPYTSGHLMVLPVRHVGELEDVTADEAVELWAVTADAVRALKAAYGPDGLNVGVNLGRAAGAGVPGHFHVHVLPRWHGDTNFMTTVASARVAPEALPATWEKVREAWPGG